MKRLVNIRISLVCALAVICGIISFHEVLFGNFVPLIVFALLTCAGVVVFACLKRKIWIVFLIALIFVAVGFFNGFRTYYTRHEDIVYSSTGVLSGRVTDIGRNGIAKNTLYLENCYLDGEKLEGRVKMYVYDGSQYNTGDIVSCNATVQNVYAIRDEVDTSSIRNNVRYETVRTDDVTVQSGSLTLGETIRKYVYDVTYEYMPQNSDVVYALLTGDRNALGSDKLDAYRSAGIVHLLVVSGLHVGFIVSVLGGIWKKLHIPTWAQLAILLAPLGFYAYICGFAPSIMRAVLMSVCVYLARAVYGKYDLLTSLCWATLIILLWQPTYLFDVGFQLSVTSVFGISTIFLQIDRAMRRRKVNRFLRKILSYLALSFSCIAATLFVNAYYFGSVSLVGIVVNIVAIPMVFVSFILCLLALFPWWFHYLAIGADYVLSGVTKIAEFLNKLNLSIPVQAVVFGIVVSVVLLFIIGGYVNLKRISKKIAYCACAVLLTLSIAATLIPRNCQNAVRVFAGYKDNLIVATSVTNEVAIVGNFCDSYTCADAAEYLSKRRTEKITIYLADYKSADVDSVKFLCQNLSLSKVYVLNTSGNDEVQSLFDSYGIEVVIAYPNVTLGDSIYVQPVFDGGLTAVVVKAGNVYVADVLSTGAEAEQFAELRYGLNYAVVRDNAEAFARNGIATISLNQQKCEGNFGANKYGNFTIYEKDGTILLNFRRY